MTESQFNQREAHYQVVERVIKTPGNRYEKYQQQGFVINPNDPDNIKGVELKHFSEHENWLNNYFPIRLNVLQGEGTYHNMFAFFMSLQRLAKDQFDAETMQQIMVSSDLIVTETDIENLDIFKSLMSEPLPVIDMLTDLINDHRNTDEAIVYQLCLVRWFIWSMMSKR